MKSKKLGLFLTLALVLTGALAFAQDAPKEEEAPIKISGLAYFSYTLGVGAMDKQYSASSLGSNYFGLDRVYLNWDHQLGKNFKYHVTLDVNSALATAQKGYIPYVHTAYTTANFGMDDVFAVNVNFGIIPTAIMANRNKMMDLRWITGNMFDGHKNLIGANFQAPLMRHVSGGAATAGILYAGQLISGGDGDQSADLGLGIDISLLKMITLTFAVTAGEGRLNVLTDQNAVNGGKAIYLDLFVEPIKGLYVTGFFRDEAASFINSIEVGTSSSVKLHKWFAGAGAGINLMGIRAGVDFEAGQNVQEFDDINRGLGGFITKNLFVLNAYVNWNLQEIAGFPLLVLGKLTYGTFTDWSLAAPNGGGAGTGRQYDSVNYMVGLGWQFNKNFKLALVFEQTIFSDASIYMGLGGDPYNTDAMALAKTPAIPTAGMMGWANSNADKKQSSLKKKALRMESLFFGGVRTGALIPKGSELLSLRGQSLSLFW
jgi:hypothetical protein